MTTIDKELAKLEKLDRDARLDYVSSKDFTRISDEKSFDEYRKIQCSGLFDYPITSGSSFIFSLDLWDSHHEDIKECFKYFDIFTVESAFVFCQDTLYKEHFNELVSNYLTHHIDSFKSSPELTSNPASYLFKFKKIAEQLSEVIGDTNLKEKIASIALPNDTKINSSNIKNRM